MRTLKFFIFLLALLSLNFANAKERDATTERNDGNSSTSTTTDNNNNSSHNSSSHSAPILRESVVDCVAITDVFASSNQVGDAHAPAAATSVHDNCGTTASCPAKTGYTAYASGAVRIRRDGAFAGSTLNSLNSYPEASLCIQTLMHKGVGYIKGLSSGATAWFGDVGGADCSNHTLATGGSGVAAQLDSNGNVVNIEVDCSHSTIYICGCLYRQS